MAEPARLAVAGLTVRRGPRPVVQGLSFTAARGELTVLLGPNGAGKSTVLKAVAGLLPHEGRVSIDGRDAATLDRRERARALAYVPQHSALEAPMPVRDVVAQGRFAHAEGWLSGGSARDAAAVDLAMERADVTALAERPFSTLSYGERRRVLLARALATGAGLLLLDEPTAALDVGHALSLLAVLRAVARDGAAVLLVLHQLQEAAAIAERAVLLAEGRARAVGPVAEVIASGPVREVYGVSMVPAAQFACVLEAAPPGAGGPGERR
jgi:iron complex transport system ATP-binding protein